FGRSPLQASCPASEGHPLSGLLAGASDKQDLHSFSHLNRFESSSLLHLIPQRVFDFPWCQFWQPTCPNYAWKLGRPQLGWSLKLAPGYSWEATWHWCSSRFCGGWQPGGRPIADAVYGRITELAGRSADFSPQPRPELHSAL